MRPLDASRIIRALRPRPRQGLGYGDILAGLLAFLAGSLTALLLVIAVVRDNGCGDVDRAGEVRR